MPMPALAEPDAKLKQWAAERIAALLQMSPGDCGEIVENILMYENQEELKAFLQPFAAESAAEYKILHFIEDLFDRRKHAVGTGPKGGDVEVEVGAGLKWCLPSWGCEPRATTCRPWKHTATRTHRKQSGAEGRHWLRV